MSVRLTSRLEFIVGLISSAGSSGRTPPIACAFPKNMVKAKRLKKFLTLPMTLNLHDLRERKKCAVSSSTSLTIKCGNVSQKWNPFVTTVFFEWVKYAPYCLLTFRHRIPLPRYSLSPNHVLTLYYIQLFGLMMLGEEIGGKQGVKVLDDISQCSCISSKRQTCPSCCYISPI